jgi:hypothetical protein
MNQQEDERGNQEEQRDGVNQTASQQARHGSQLI